MRTVLVFLALVATLFACQLQAQDCYINSNGQKVCRTPIRSIITAQPVRSTAKVVYGTMAKISGVANASCAGSAVPSCAGTRAASCAGSGKAMEVVVAPVAPVVVYECVQTVQTVQSYSSVAQQSADYRAANGIKGHTRFESGRMAGVGFSSFNSNPATCFNNMGGDYAVARGRDGWYATRIVR